MRSMCLSSTPSKARSDQRPALRRGALRGRSMRWGFIHQHRRRRRVRLRTRPRHSPMHRRRSRTTMALRNLHQHPTRRLAGRSLRGRSRPKERPPPAGLGFEQTSGALPPSSGRPSTQTVIQPSMRRPSLSSSDTSSCAASPPPSTPPPAPPAWPWSPPASPRRSTPYTPAGGSD